MPPRFIAGKWEKIKIKIGIAAYTGKTAPL